MFSKVLRQAFFNNNIALYRNGKGLKTIIIGGVAGGASAAARLRRLDESAKIMMIEMGPYVSFANCG
jgi:hypothetical protein